MEKGHKVALKNYIDATNTHDFQHVRKLLHKDAVYWFSDKTCSIPDEIQRYFENSWNTINEEIYGAQDVSWIAEDENTATCLYTYTYEGYFNGKFVQGSGRATNVFVKNESEEWKLIHEHLSSN